MLTDEQRQRVADALESAQSENARQFRQFSAWCEHENYFPVPAFPEMVAAYAAELADERKSMYAVRLAVASDAHTQTHWRRSRRPRSHPEDHEAALLSRKRQLSDAAG